MRCRRVSKASALASKNSTLRISKEISICSAWERRIGGGGRGEAMGYAGYAIRTCEGLPETQALSRV